MKRITLRIFSVRSFVIFVASMILVIGAIMVLPSFNEDNDSGGLRADIPRVTQTKNPEYKYEYETPTFTLYAGLSGIRPKIELVKANRSLRMFVNKNFGTPAVEDGSQGGMNLVNTDKESYVDYDDFKIIPQRDRSLLEFEIKDRNSIPVIDISTNRLRGQKVDSKIIFITRTNRKAYSLTDANVVDSNGQSSNVELNIRESKEVETTRLNHEQNLNFSIDDTWLASNERSYPLKLTVKLNALLDKKILPMRPVKPTFKANEPLEFEIDTLYINDLDLQSKLLKGDFNDIRFGLLDVFDETLELNAKLKKKEGDVVTVELTSNSPATWPGLFDLLMQYADNPAFISESGFAWGVLAMNSDQSVYKTNSSANFDFAVLDKYGTMVCDAKLSLVITEPDGNTANYSTEAGNIEVTEGCRQKITDLPDYTAKYEVKGEGEYKLMLIAETRDGMYSIEDKIVVDDKSPFYIKRKSHTRIFPWTTYGMQIEVTKGTGDGKVIIDEKMDREFVVISTDGIVADPIGNERHITWERDFAQSSTYTIGYRYDAPDTSPAMFLNGPIKVSQSNDKQIVFDEGRAWQIAVDAVDVITSGTTYNVPSTWNDSDNTIEVIGGGGAGVVGGSNVAPSGGGGGGGAYGKSVNVNMPEGSTVNLNIGVGQTVSGVAGGNTWICNSTSFCGTYTDSSVVASAKGGSGASGATGGAGGDTSGVVSGTGSLERTGGSGGNGLGTTGRGGGGGGGAAGPNGNGAAGGASGNFAPSGGGGGGGNGGGTAGSASSSSSGANGGNNSGSSGGGSGGTGNTDCASGGAGGNGSSGGGGGGGAGMSSTAGGACTGGSGSQGTEWTGAGSGGGGGGGGGNTRTAGNGNDGGLGGSGTANTGGGGGGGGSCDDSGCAGGSNGSGGSGVIVISYTPVVTGPTTDEVMRHGNWFSGGVEQGFHWVN